MKLSSIFSFKAIASLAVVAFWTLGVQAQNASSRTVRVTGLSGSAKISHGGDAFVPLGINARVGKGDVIKTGAGSHVDLDMGGNVGVVQIAPNSTLGIDEATTTSTGTDVLTDTQLSLTGGAMYAKVNRLAKGSRFEMTTPKGIAGIRGSGRSALYLTAAGQLTMADGEAGIAYGANDVEIVHEGETIGLNDRPAHRASDQLLHDVEEALRDASSHGSGPTLEPFVPPIEPFISPTLPGR